MTLARLSRASVTGVPNVKARLSRASVSGTGVIAPGARLSQASITGQIAVLLNDLVDRSVEPLTVQSITAVTSPGSAVPSSYTWRVVSGTVTPIVGSGATVTITAPAHMLGTFVVIGVRGTNGSVISPEQTIRIDVAPQILWAASTTAWLPVAVTAL